MAEAPSGNLFCPSLKQTEPEVLQLRAMEWEVPYLKQDGTGAWPRTASFMECSLWSPFESEVFAFEFSLGMLKVHLCPAGHNRYMPWHRHTLWNTPRPSVAPGLLTQNQYTVGSCCLCVMKIHLKHRRETSGEQNYLQRETFNQRRTQKPFWIIDMRVDW